MVLAPNKGFRAILEAIVTTCNLLGDSPRYWKYTGETSPYHWKDGGLCLTEAGRWRSNSCLWFIKRHGWEHVPSSIYDELRRMVDALPDEEQQTPEPQAKVADLFAASCGSLGEFTDIKQSEEGYAMTRQMKHFNFPVRNLDGTFYAQVHPFDPSFFAVKVHPSGVLLFTPHHPQLTLLQHIILQAPFLKKPVQFLDDTPKYWLEDDGTMCLHPSHRWKSDDTIAWLRKRGLHSVPNSIKAEIGDLVYNGPKQNDDSTASTPPPGRFVYFTGSRASNDPPPGL